MKKAHREGSSSSVGSALRQNLIAFPLEERTDAFAETIKYPSFS
jgi:hypothetical protein